MEFQTGLLLPYTYLYTYFAIVANVISAMLVEDFTWFFYRWWLPLDNAPKINASFRLDYKELRLKFYITYKSVWYFIAIIIAGIFYYYAFKRPK
jgi:hypothetical protein